MLLFLRGSTFCHIPSNTLRQYPSLHVASLTVVQFYFILFHSNDGIDLLSTHLSVLQDERKHSAENMLCHNYIW